LKGNWLKSTGQKLISEIMKRKSIKLLIAIIILTVVSCNGPDTVVTDFVNTDGSVTRKIEMKSNEGNAEKRFRISDLKVPIDNTWTIRDSIEVGKKGDTTWVKRAEKLFKSAEDINLAYKSDSGANKEFTRHSEFKKRFKWFNTEYRFCEIIDNRFSFEYPVKDFLNKEELNYFYSPDNLKHDKENGSDSLKFRALADTINLKTDKWTAKNLVSGWISEFSKLTAGKSDSGISYQALKSHEDKFVVLIEQNDKNFDSLWKNGILLKELIGKQNALRYKTEADSALSIVSNNLLANFGEYTIRIVMPGKLIGTNGFIDSSRILLWPVKSDFFITGPYEMWAESKMSNKWAWIVSGLFVAFVISGVILRITKKD
jgi:hypothetical protein